MAVVDVESIRSRSDSEMDDLQELDSELDPPEESASASMLHSLEHTTQDM